MEKSFMPIPTIGSEQSVSERVRQYLRDQERILPRISAKYLLERTFGKHENEKSLKDIYELHLKTPGMPLLESEKVFLAAVINGVRSGAVGLRENSKVLYMEHVIPNLDSIVMRGEVAKKLKAEEELGENDKGKQEGPAATGEEKKVAVKPGKTRGIVKSLKFRATIS